jgi:phosphate transport system protein
MMNEPTHTVTRYDQELERLRGIVARMGGLVERQTAQAIAAVVDQNEEAAREPPRLDAEVDMLEREAEQLAIRILALRAPMAVDLRQIVAVLKMSGDLERIGDYASSIARRALKVEQLEGALSFSALRAMGRLVQENLHKAVEAMVENDATRAKEVWNADTEVDEIYTSMFRELVTYMMEDPRNIGPCIHLLFMAKNLERIGDHATNIAERIYYAVTGDMLPAERPRGGRCRQDHSRLKKARSGIQPYNGNGARHHGAPRSVSYALGQIRDSAFAIEAPAYRQDGGFCGKAAGNFVQRIRVMFARQKGKADAGCAVRGFQHRHTPDRIASV